MLAVGLQPGSQQWQQSVNHRNRTALAATVTKSKASNVLLYGAESCSVMWTK